MDEGNSFLVIAGLYTWNLPWASLFIRSWLYWWHSQPHLKQILTFFLYFLTKSDFIWNRRACYVAMVTKIKVHYSSCLLSIHTCIKFLNCVCIYLQVFLDRRKWWALIRIQSRNKHNYLPGFLTWDAQRRCNKSGTEVVEERLVFDILASLYKCPPTSTFPADFLAKDLFLFDWPNTLTS